MRSPLTHMTGVILLLLVFAAMLSLLFALRFGGNYVTTNISPAQLKDCENLMRLAFPPQTQPIGFWALTGTGTRIHLKVRIPTADVESLIRESAFHRVPLNAQERALRGEPGAPAWWNPDAAEKFESAETVLATGEKTQRLAILISPDTPEFATVFLCWVEEPAAVNRKQ